MAEFLSYIVVSSLTIASPGPGVVLTLSNGLNYSIQAAMPSILGIAAGMFLIAVIASGSVGLVLSSSDTAFVYLQWLGAGYLAFLGFRLLGSAKQEMEFSQENQGLTWFSGLTKGFCITVLNPKPIVFFMALFPHYIQGASSYMQRFLVLSLSFCALIVVIHSLYAVLARRLSKLISSGNGQLLINRVSGLCFLIFAVVLLRM